MNRILVLLVMSLTVLSYLFLSAPPLQSSSRDVDQVRYYYLGSYKAILGKPKGKGPFPVVIYSYDEFYDWAGKTLSNKKGYSLEGIADYFAKLGYVCVIPLERYRKVNAIMGVSSFIQKKPYVDPNQLHLVGMSEGAFMNFISAEKLPLFASMTAIGAIEINDKGYLSYGEFLHRTPASPRMPVLFMMIHDVGWRINSQKKVFEIMNSFYRSFDSEIIYKEKRWFWNIEHYGADIHAFIKKHKSRYPRRKHHAR